MREQLNQLKEQLYDIQERIRKLEEGLNALDFYDNMPVLTVVRTGRATYPPPEPTILAPALTALPSRRTCKELREAIQQLMADGQHRSDSQIAKALGETYARIHHITRNKGRKCDT